MKKFLTVFCLILCFIGWILHRFFIKKDLKNHLNEFYFGLFFIGIWVVIYYFSEL
jgi:hypothetical protein